MHAFLSPARRGSSKIQRPPSVLAKVMGQLGLRVDHQQIIPAEEYETKRKVALDGWAKVRNCLHDIRQNKNAGFLYSQQTHKILRNENSLLIFPQSRLRVFIVCLQSGIILYHMMMVPYRYAWNQIYESQPLIVTDMVLDLIYVFIIVARFFFVFTKKARYIVSLRQIALRYIFSLDSSGLFIVDVLATYPYYFSGDLYWLRMLRYLQTGLVLKGYSIFWKKLIGLMTSNINFIRSLTDILKFLLILFMIAQCLASIWYYLGSQTNVYEGYDEELGKPVLKDGWVTNLLYLREPYATQQTEYITALYWVFTTLTTLGYGDYYGTTTQEYVFTMLVQFLGVFVFAYMMGNINLLVEKLDDDHLEYLQIENEKLDQWLIKVSRANQQRRLSDAFVEELRLRFNFYWQRDHQFVGTWLKQLPYKLQQELVYAIFGRFLHDFGVFFKGLESQFTQAVVVSLYPKQFLIKNGDIEIIPADSCPNEVYFITKGVVAVLTKAGERYLTLQAQSYFGEHLVLFNLKSSNIYSTQGKDVECMCISKERFLQLCSVYPYSKRLLKQKAYVRRQYMHDLKQRKMRIREQKREMELTAKWRPPDARGAAANMLTSQDNSASPAQNRILMNSQQSIAQSQPSLVRLARQTAERIEQIKVNIGQMEKNMKSKMAQIKIEIEFITKYEEILSGM